MNSFLGLSQVQQASLSTVAPGIAEALIATAIGLFAAIPAVIAYNRFAARGQTLLTRYYAFGNELQARLHRKLHGSPVNLAKDACAGRADDRHSQPHTKTQTSNEAGTEDG